MNRPDPIPPLRRRHGLAKDAPALSLPAYRARLATLPASRRRAFMRHLSEAIAEAFAKPAAPPDPPPALPAGRAALAAACCACCRGQCCSRGGEHAYLDADTIRRLRRADPALGRAAILARYRAMLGGESCEASCVFHGADGCRLERALRSDLCNSFVCNDLDAALRHEGPALLLAREDGEIRRAVPYRPPTKIRT